MFLQIALRGWLGNTPAYYLMDDDIKTFHTKIVDGVVNGATVVLYRKTGNLDLKIGSLVGDDQAIGLIGLTDRKRMADILNESFGIDEVFWISDEGVKIEVTRPNSARKREDLLVHVRINNKTFLTYRFGKFVTDGALTIKGHPVSVEAGSDVPGEWLMGFSDQSSSLIDLAWAFVNNVVDVYDTDVTLQPPNPHDVLESIEGDF